MRKAPWAVVIANMALFILLTSHPDFQDIHHHWIFPLLAILFGAEWALAGGLVPWSKPFWRMDPRLIRPAVLSLLAFLMLLGIVRHWTILRCEERCSLKLGIAALLAGAVFLGQASKEDPVWGRARSQTAGVACVLWGAWLFFFGMGMPPEVLDVVFLGVFAVLLAGWKHDALRMCAIGLPLALAIPRIGRELPVILLGLALALTGLILATRWNRPPPPEY